MKRKPKCGFPPLFDKPKCMHRNIIERMFGWLAPEKYWSDYVPQVNDVHFNVLVYIRKVKG
ncbi:hypothetical protein PSCICO_49960 [Pseudomonas cichorii]|nr:hypothetical protein PSCICO_49960 [Pseudomonas cichorii]